MPWTKAKTASVTVAGLLVAAGTAIVMVSSRSASNSLAVRADPVIRGMATGAIQWNAGMTQLWSMGPEIIPCLANQARLKDSLLTKEYARLWRKMPATLQHYFPSPVDPAQLRQTAMHAIQEFGPLAVRRAAPQVIEGLTETDDRYNDYAVSCERWLLPESAQALDVFKRGLAGTNANWPLPQAFLNVDDSVWPQVPELVPLLTALLGNSGIAYHAAIALGRIGAPASGAIPALIQTVDVGAAGPFPDAEAARYHAAEAFSNPLGWHLATIRQDDKGMNHNRAMAALALGRIGVPAPGVSAALARAWNARDAWVRLNAAEAVSLLGASMTNESPKLLDGLLDPDNAALGRKILAIGKMGSSARDALATLRELAKPSRLQTLLADPQRNIVGDTVDDLSVAAKMAICRIDPQEGRPFLQDIVNRIGFWWDPVQFLTESGPLSDDVVRLVEPLLEEPANGSQTAGRQSIAAYIILSHDPHDSRALAVLHRNRATGEINDRLLAGRFLFETLGETNGLCQLIEEGFRSPESFIGQTAGNIASEMGNAALPSVPTFKAALWHQDQFVRARAGRLILKLAPQELPINQGKARKW
jgi:hypothetical protein